MCVKWHFHIFFICARCFQSLHVTVMYGYALFTLLLMYLLIKIHRHTHTLLSTNINFKTLHDQLINTQGKM